MEEKEFVPEAPGTTPRYLDYNGLSILVDNIKELIAAESNSKRVVITVPESKLSGNMFSNVDSPISFETEYTLDNIKKIMSPDVLVLFDFPFSEGGIRGQLVAISKVDSTSSFDLTTSRGYASMVAIGVDAEWSKPNGTIFSIYFSKSEQGKYVININPLGSSLTDIGSLTESNKALELYSFVIFDIDKGIESSISKDFGENFWFAGSYLDSFDANGFWNNYVCNHPILVKQNNILYPVISKSIVTNSSYYQRDIVFEYFGANRKRNIVSLGTYDGFPASCKLHEGDSCIFMHFIADSTDLSTSDMLINLSDNDIPIELKVKDYKEHLILICDNYDESSCEVRSFICTHIGNGNYEGMALDSSLNCIIASISISSKTVTISKKVIDNSKVPSPIIEIALVAPTSPSSGYENGDIMYQTSGTKGFYSCTVSSGACTWYSMSEMQPQEDTIYIATKDSNKMYYYNGTDMVVLGGGLTSTDKTKLNNISSTFNSQLMSDRQILSFTKGAFAESGNNQVIINGGTVTLDNNGNWDFGEDGDNAIVIKAATGTDAGVMSAEDKAKLDKIAAPPILQTSWNYPTTTTSVSATVSDLKQGQIKVFGDGYDMCLVALAGNNRSDRLIYLNWVCNVLSHKGPINIGVTNQLVNVTQEADYNILKNGYISTFQMGYTLAGVNSDGTNLYGRVTMTSDGDGCYSGMKMLGDNLDRLIVFKIKPKEDTQQCYVTIKEIKFVE